MPTALRSLLFVSLVVLIAPPASAVDPPVNAALIGRFDLPDVAHTDVWAVDGIAFMGRAQWEVDIVDIRDPTNPVLYATHRVGTSSLHDAADVKAGDGLLFVGLVNSSPVGARIVDVRDPAHPVTLTDVTVGGRNTHNLFYDKGWLYLADFGFNEVVYVIDLRNYDPDNPPATINTATWTITEIGGRPHDVTVLNDRLYVSAWNGGLRVYDVSEIATSAPTFLGSAPGVELQASWATDDGRFVVTTQDFPGTGATLWEVTEGVGSITLTEVDSLVLDPSRARRANNPLIVGDRVYVSWYSAGILVLEIDRTTKTLQEIASYDTSDGSPNGISGNWGVYPVLGAHRVLASDSANGLFVLSIPDDLIFSNGFESGDTSAWSSTTP